MELSKHRNHPLVKQYEDYIEILNAEIAWWQKRLSNEGISDYARIVARKKIHNLFIELQAKMNFLAEFISRLSKQK
jgi:hypothetical protein